MVCTVDTNITVREQWLRTTTILRNVQFEVAQDRCSNTSHAGATNALALLKQEILAKEWRTAESRWGLGYNDIDVVDSSVGGAQTGPQASFEPAIIDNSRSEIFTGYLSDDGYSADGFDTGELDFEPDANASPHLNSVESNVVLAQSSAKMAPGCCNGQPPPLKHHHLAIPARKRHQLQAAQAKCRKKLTKALKVIEKLIWSKYNNFDMRSHGLQAYWAQCIQSYLRVVVHNG
ncbi:hypothetical protein C8Q78DRAFT_992921 [Trametes maxima]|nr:hypothetical protein C8Q78DRAFT_992921 [Trametes maxima]